MNKTVQQRVDKDFVKYIKKVYGDLDMPVITKKHTVVLQQMMSNKKRASLYDVLYWSVLLTFIGLVLLLGANFTDRFNEKAQAMEQFDADSKEMVQDMEDIYTVYIDKAFVMAFIGEVMITFILGMMIAVHPIFYLFYIPGWMFAIYLSAVMSNLYQKAAQMTALAGAAELIPWTTYMIIWMPFIIGIGGLILAVGMYKIYKNKQE